MNTEHFVELDDVSDGRMHVRFTTPRARPQLATLSAGDRWGNSWGNFGLCPQSSLH